MKQVVEAFAINKHLGDHESGPGEHGPRHALDEKAGAEMERCKWHLPRENNFGARLNWCEHYRTVRGPKTPGSGFLRR